MVGSVRVVWGLPRESQGAMLLLDALVDAGVELQLQELVGSGLAQLDGADAAVVVLLPVLGDNDLKAELRAHLAGLAAYVTRRQTQIVVIAQGDRHVSDEAIDPAMPFSIKLRHLFREASAFEILRTKLDRFTAAELAAELVAILTVVRPRDALLLDDIARLLPRAPLWDVRRRLLDFYDSSTGSSLLDGVAPATLERIAALTQTLAPHRVKMTHAGLRDADLPRLVGALQSDVLDLGSNAFTWERLVPVLGACRWLGLAANGLTRALISQMPEGLQHLYLHKNELLELPAESERMGGLKSLSLYRNQLKHFQWPAGHASLERLNIGANPIASLPDTLGQCSSLAFLGLARTRVSTLPDWIFASQSLRELDISYIEERIPPHQVAKLRAERVSIITRPGFVLP
ncbi:leucine-rich repeat domain-containing protein [Stenotrophomonas maltophilia]|nr:leucine-rich repeat domain-containing protein [Stenotrophomonas maltophilia]